MSICAPLLSQDPASPRLTVYNEHTGARMEFSALTLENWASKIANFLDEEIELDTEATVIIDLPVSWQAAVIALGALNSLRTISFGHNSDGPAEVVFTDVEGAARWTQAQECVVVADDPFGRGVVESGGELPAGTIDFGPTVRFYGDQYFGATADLADWARPDVDASRTVITGWSSAEEFSALVMAKLAAGGSVVVVSGTPSPERLAHISNIEKAQRPIDTPFHG